MLAFDHLIRYYYPQPPGGGAMSPHPSLLIWVRASSSSQVALKGFEHSPEIDVSVRHMARTTLHAIRKISL